MSFTDALVKYGNISNKINRPIEGESFSPFVIVTFRNSSGKEILTVGNRSRPDDNTAIIKSFQLGLSNGMGAVIEIFDEKGGNFEKAFNALNKSLNESKEKSQQLGLDFGWIVEKNSCGSSKPQISVIKASESAGGELCLTPQVVKISYEQGKIKYILECNTAVPLLAQSRVECNIGADKNKVYLKQAIETLLKERTPGPMLGVKFLNSKGTGPLKFKVSDSNGGTDGVSSNGPKGVWTANQQGKLDTIRRWLAPLCTENDKGIIIYWEGKKDPNNPSVGGTIVIQEDPGMGLCGNELDDSKHLGTYVVNGGEHSPVLSFHPSVNWNFGGVAKDGGTQSSVSGEQAKMKGDSKAGCPDNRDKGGTATYTGTQGEQMHYRAADNQAKESAKSDAAHQLANSKMEGLQAIEAELRIIGDPRYCFPWSLIGARLSLVVINPYHLRKTYLGCPDWLAEPLANPVFSNKNWLITGADHQIKEGSFVTTLKIQLAAPGVDLNPDIELGGKDSGGQLFSIRTNPDTESCNNN